MNGRTMKTLQGTRTEEQVSKTKKRSEISDRLEEYANYKTEQINPLLSGRLAQPLLESHTSGRQLIDHYKNSFGNENETADESPEANKKNKKIQEYYKKIVVSDISRRGTKEEKEKLIDAGIDIKKSREAKKTKDIKVSDTELPIEILNSPNVRTTGDGLHTTLEMDIVGALYSSVSKVRSGSELSMKLEEAENDSKETDTPVICISARGLEMYKYGRCSKDLLKRVKDAIENIDGSPVIILNKNGEPIEKHYYYRIINACTPDEADEAMYQITLNSYFTKGRKSSFLPVMENHARLLSKVDKGSVGLRRCFDEIASKYARQYMKSQGKDGVQKTEALAYTFAFETLMNASGIKLSNHKTKQDFRNSLSTLAEMLHAVNLVEDGTWDEKDGKPMEEGRLYGVEINRTARTFKVHFNRNYVSLCKTNGRIGNKIIFSESEFDDFCKTHTSLEPNPDDQ